MSFRTKLDYSDNRQIQQRPETHTILSGGTAFGVTFSALTTGPDLLTSGITSSDYSVASTFSGNSATTVYDWFDPIMQLGYPTLTALTPSTSADTQFVMAYSANTTTVIDGNTVTLDYVGVYYDIACSDIYDLGGGNYSGTAISLELFFLSAEGLDYTGRTIWADVSGITRTENLIITNNPVIGNVWTCIDTEGRGYWSPSSGSSGSSVWELSTGVPSAVLVGSSSLASGNYSVAEGNYTTATGDTSHAEGSSTTAYGYAAHAEGGYTTASQDYSHAEGQGTQALGPKSHSEGEYTTAFGYASHAEGYGALASGTSSHAEGYYTTAFLLNSHAEGYYSIAGGIASHAEGYQTYTNGTGGHSEGYQTTSLGTGSHAEGYLTLANGTSTHAEGSGTTASGQYSHSEGYQTIASGDSAHAEGRQTIAGDFSHAEGRSNLALDYSHAEGHATTATGHASHAQNEETQATGQFSHAGGMTSIASGTTSFVHGSNSIAGGAATIVLGNSITGLTSNMTYVDNLNIKTIGAGPGTSIAVDGTGQVVYTTSDLRLKENISTLTNALDKVKNLRGVSFQLKDRTAGGDEFRIGFIAQEVNEIVPELTFVNKTIPEEYMGVHYDNVTALLVEAIKEIASGSTSITNDVLHTQTVVAEDNNIDLNFGGNQQTAIDGGIKVLHAKGIDLSADFILDANGDWTTNNDFKPNQITIPLFTPSGSTDTTGGFGNITRDDAYIYVKCSDGWKRSNLESF